MNAIQLLKLDHKHVEELFREYERLDGRRNARTLVQRIIKELKTHSAVEQQALYPTVASEVPDTRRLVLKSLEEHHLTNVELSELERMSADDERCEAKMLVLIDTMRMHIQEEENVLFPAMRQVMSKKRLDEIGENIERIKRRPPREISTEVPRLPRGGARANGASVLQRAQRETQKRIVAAGRAGGRAAGKVQRGRARATRGATA
jgi:hemerythrin-like domain-containing protein